VPPETAPDSEENSQADVPVDGTRGPRSQRPRKRKTAVAPGTGNTAVITPPSDTDPDFQLAPTTEEEAEGSAEGTAEIEIEVDEEAYRREQELEDQRRGQQHKEQAERARQLAEAQAREVEQRRKQAQEATRRAAQRAAREEEEDEGEGAREDRWKRRRNYALLAACGLLLLLFYGGYFTRSLYYTLFPVKMSEVPVETLVGEYKSDPQAATEKYADKRVVVTGKIIIKTDKTQYPVRRRYFFEVPGSPSSFECDFADVEEASSISSGKTYKISGLMEPPAQGSSTLQLKHASLMGETS
jgi:hypothetical protein